MNQDERRAKDLLTSGLLREMLTRGGLPKATVDVLLRWGVEGAVSEGK